MLRNNETPWRGETTITFRVSLSEAEKLTQLVDHYNKSTDTRLLSRSVTRSDVVRHLIVEEHNRMMAA